MLKSIYDCASWNQLFIVIKWANHHSLCKLSRYKLWFYLQICRWAYLCMNLVSILYCMHAFICVAFWSNETVGWMCVFLNFRLYHTLTPCIQSNRYACVILRWSPWQTGWAVFWKRRYLTNIYINAILWDLLHVLHKPAQHVHVCIVRKPTPFQGRAHHETCCVNSATAEWDSSPALKMGRYTAFRNMHHHHLEESGDD